MKSVRTTKFTSDTIVTVIAHDGAEYEIVKNEGVCDLMASCNMSFIKSFISKRAAFKHLSTFA